MYEIIHFRGGIYKFDELVEFVEDTGGMVLKKDCFEIIRGDSYLSKEVHVLLVVPDDELDSTKSLISDIKGMVDDIDTTDDQYNLFLSYLSIYDALNRIGKWTDRDVLKDAIRCPCYSELCIHLEEEKCQLDEILEEILAELCLIGIIEHREVHGTTQFRLKKE